MNAISFSLYERLFIAGAISTLSLMSRNMSIESAIQPFSLASPPHTCATKYAASNSLASRDTPRQTSRTATCIVQISNRVYVHRVERVTGLQLRSRPARYKKQDLSISQLCSSTKPFYCVSTSSNIISLQAILFNMMPLLCLVITLAAVAYAVPVSNSARTAVTKRQQENCVFLPPLDECAAGYGICDETDDGTLCCPLDDTCFV
ncbi:hypothetical protein BDW69DRAFT_36046 [Aspergillus filifer]